MFNGRFLYCNDFAAVINGLSNTLMLGKRRSAIVGSGMFSYHMQGFPTGMQINSSLTNKADPGDWQHNYGAGSFHAGGAHFCMGDGAVRFFSNNIDFQLYNYLGGRSDNQAVAF